MLQEAEMCLVSEAIDLLFCESNMNKEIHKEDIHGHLFEQRDACIAFNQFQVLITAYVYAELQTVPFIMTTAQKMTRGVSCDWLQKCIPATVAGWARKIAATVGQNASSGLDLLNELTCSCWQH